MRFRTELQLTESNRKISHSNQIFGMGSCFIDSIGEKLENSKFPVLKNPYGTLFHPLAMETALARIHSMAFYTEEEIFKYGELYFSWDHHTTFSQVSLKSTLEKINNELEFANEFIQKSDVFFLTFGTSFAYKIKELGLFVANCHKVPQQHFEKILLSDSQIKSSIKNCFNLITDINPKARIITTISPVRHIKDGIIENNISKSKLISNLAEVSALYENVEYFPAYEFMMDDLRDYRFYKRDLIHPNETAVDYIWQKFSERYFDEQTKSKIKTAEKINVSVVHKPLNKASTSYKEFLYKTIKGIESVENQFPKDSFYAEKLILKNLLKNAD